MANPITWRTVNAPNSNGAIYGLDRASDRISQALKGITQTATDYGQGKVDRNTATFMDALAGYKNEEDLKAAQAAGVFDQLRASFGGYQDRDKLRSAITDRVSAIRNQATADYDHQQTLAIREATPLQEEIQAAVNANDTAKAEALYSQGFDILNKANVADTLAEAITQKENELYTQGRERKAHKREDQATNREDLFRELSFAVEQEDTAQRAAQEQKLEEYYRLAGAKKVNGVWDLSGIPAQEAAAMQRNIDADVPDRASNPVEQLRKQFSEAIAANTEKYGRMSAAEINARAEQYSQGRVETQDLTPEEDVIYQQGQQTYAKQADIANNPFFDASGRPLNTNEEINRINQELSTALKNENHPLHEFADNISGQDKSEIVGTLLQAVNGEYIFGGHAYQIPANTLITLLSGIDDGTINNDDLTEMINKYVMTDGFQKQMQARDWYVRKTNALKRSIGNKRQSPKNQALDSLFEARQNQDATPFRTISPSPVAITQAAREAEEKRRKFNEELDYLRHSGR